MAHGNQLPCVLRRLNARYLGHCQNIAFFHRAGPNAGHGLRKDMDLSHGHGGPVCDGLFCHIYHFRPALFIEMGQHRHTSSSDLVHVSGGVAGAVLQVVLAGFLQNALSDCGLQRRAVKTAQGDFPTAVEAAL